MNEPVPNNLIDGIRELTEFGVKWKDSGSFYSQIATLVATATEFRIKLETGEEFVIANNGRVSDLFGSIRKQLGLVKDHQALGGMDVLAGDKDAPPSNPLTELGSKFGSRS